MTAAPSCPRCRLGLFQGQAANVVMLACGRCGGVWLDNAAARKIQEVAPDEAIALADRASAHGSAAIDDRAPAPCPACAKPMARTPVAAARVEVDTCSKHGTWFDKHELHAVASAFTEIRKRRGPSGYAIAGIAAGAVAVGVAGAAVVAAQDPALQSRAQSMASSASDVAASVGSVAVDVAEVAVDVAASGALDVVGDVAIGAVGLIFSIFD